MEALRTLTVEQSTSSKPMSLESVPLNPCLVRDYHKQYYVPHNLSLVIAGKMSKGTPSILSVLQEQVESSIVAHGQNHGPKPVGWKRPFLETPSVNRPPITKSHQETVTFPEKDESLGELVISYMGPPASEFLERKVRKLDPFDSRWMNNWVSFQALDILSVYLTSSPVAPLNKEYIEVETPLW